MSLIYDGTTEGGPEQAAGASSTPKRESPDRQENFLSHPSSEKDAEDEWGNILNQPKRMNRWMYFIFVTCKDPYQSFLVPRKLMQDLLVRNQQMCRLTILPLPTACQLQTHPNF